MKNMRVSLKTKNASATSQLFLRPWRFLFPVSVYSDWLPLLPNNAPRRSALEKCSAQPSSTSGRCSEGIREPGPHFLRHCHTGCLVFPARVAAEIYLPHRHLLVDLHHCRIRAMLITLLTVSYQAIKAAIANPVRSLRTE